MGGALGLLIFGYFIVKHIRKNGLTPDRTNPPANDKFIWIWLAYFALAIFIFVAIFTAQQPDRLFIYSGTLILTLGLVILFPLVFAQVAVYFGRVKISFYLGRIAYLKHREDVFAGALYYGWRALKRVKPENKERDERWLQQRLAAHTGTLGSGAMLVHALLKCAALNYKELRAHFNFLQGLNKNWIPANLARRLFRIILANACTVGDFNEVRVQARYWQLVGGNPFAQWVDMYHWSIGAEKIPFFLRLKIAWLNLRVGNATLKNYLLQLKNSAVIAVPASYSFTELKQIEASLYAGAHTNAEPLNAAWRHYLSTQAADEWMPRIQALGCFNTQAVYERL
ncbi:MAG: hypothetical protein EOO68_00405, partial [Moraxellaceae bacterium]